MVCPPDPLVVTSLARQHIVLGTVPDGRAGSQGGAEQGAVDHRGVGRCRPLNMPFTSGPSTTAALPTPFSQSPSSRLALGGRRVSPTSSPISGTNPTTISRIA